MKNFSPLFHATFLPTMMLVPLPNLTSCNSLKSRVLSQPLVSFFSSFCWFIYLAVPGLSCHMWDLPWPGMETWSPAWEHRAVGTGPPEKSQTPSFWWSVFRYERGSSISSSPLWFSAIDLGPTWPWTYQASSFPPQCVVRISQLPFGGSLLLPLSLNLLDQFWDIQVLTKLDRRDPSISSFTAGSWKYMLPGLGVISYNDLQTSQAPSHPWSLGTCYSLDLKCSIITWMAPSYHSSLCSEEPPLKIFPNTAPHTHITITVFALTPLNFYS